MLYNLYLVRFIRASSSLTASAYGEDPVKIFNWILVSPSPKASVDKNDDSLTTKANIKLEALLGLPLAINEEVK